MKAPCLWLFLYFYLYSKNLGPELANKNTSEVDYIPLNILEGAIEGLEEDQVDSSGVKPSGGGRSAPSVTGGLSGDIHSVEGQEVVIRYGNGWRLSLIVDNTGIL